MVSRENAVILFSILVALLVGVAVYQFTDLPSWVALAVFIGFREVVPTAIKESTN